MAMDWQKCVTSVGVGPVVCDGEAASFVLGAVHCGGRRRKREVVAIRRGGKGAQVVTSPQCRAEGDAIVFTTPHKNAVQLRPSVGALA